jgi:anti-anti-sigma factor
MALSPTGIEASISRCQKALMRLAQPQKEPPQVVLDASGQLAPGGIRRNRKRIQPVPGVLEVIVLGGEVDLHSNYAWSEQAQSKLPANILVDFQDVSYIDSRCLAELCVLQEKAEQAGSVLGIYGVTENVRPIFEIARLDQVFKVLPAGSKPGQMFFRPTNVQIATEADVKIEEINKELMAYFAAHPEALHDVSPEKFEKIVTAILEDMGCTAVHVGKSGDQGRDIFATLKTPFATLVIILECKRYARHRPVPIATVRSFLSVIELQERASFGILATTSFFQSGARALERQWQSKLGLADLKLIQEWLAQYGKWTTTGNSALWLSQAKSDEDL